MIKLAEYASRTARSIFADSIEISVQKEKVATVTWRKGREAYGALVNLETGDVYLRD